MAPQHNVALLVLPSHHSSNSLFLQPHKEMERRKMISYSVTTAPPSPKMPTGLLRSLQLKYVVLIITILELNVHKCTIKLVPTETQRSLHWCGKRWVSAEHRIQSLKTITAVGNTERISGPKF